LGAILSANWERCSQKQDGSSSRARMHMGDVMRLQCKRSFHSRHCVRSHWASLACALSYVFTVGSYSTCGVIEHAATSITCTSLCCTVIVELQLRAVPSCQ
jgi:hypothetical protein